MLRNQLVVVGKSYVNERERVVREVIEDIDGRKVKYNAFRLDNGRLIPAPNQICHMSQLARWADREATPREVARLHPYQQAPWFEELPVDERAQLELERAKADLQQVVGSQGYHRW